MQLILRSLGVVLLVSMFAPRVMADDKGALTPATQPSAKTGKLTSPPQIAREQLVGWMELSGSLPDAPPPFGWVSEEETKPSLRRVLRELKRAASDNRYVGLVIFLDEPDLDLSQIDEIAQAMQEVRGKGKRVMVFAESYDLRGYLLACAADQILLLRKGQLELAGLGMEEIYLAGLLEKVGAKADFLQVGAFKGAEEPFTRRGPSPEWSKNIDALLDDMYAQVLRRIADARKLQPAEVEKAMADCWTMSDEQYVQRKLVDTLTERDLIEITTETWGDDFAWDDLHESRRTAPQADNPFALFRMLFEAPEVRARRPSIAVINASGPITGGRSGNGGGIFGGETIGSRTLEEVLGDARDDDMIKGVVLRIDSPGGSAMASEVIWQALRNLGDEKPLYVSIGSTAASGGYYMACAGEKIYVSPSSIVGSIGVVGGKIVLGGLYDKIGLDVTRRSRGPLGDMFNSVEGFTPPQRAALQSAFRRTYDQFTDRVSVGRGDRIRDMDAVAQGRLFTGKQAVANGLADQVGGIDVAVADLAKQVGLRPGAYDVINLPPPMSLGEYLEQLFGGLSAAPASDDQAALRAARLLLGERAWRNASRTMDGMMLMRREPVLTLMPAVVVVK